MPPGLSLTIKREDCWRYFGYLVLAYLALELRWNTTCLVAPGERAADAAKDPSRFWAVLSLEAESGS